MFLTSESRMIPGPGALGLGIGFREHCWCHSLGIGWPGHLVTPTAAMALTFRIAPRTSQSFRSRMTWRAGAGPFLQERGCYQHSPLLPLYPVPLHTPGPPHLLQGVAGQLAALAKDRSVVFGCKPLQLGTELLFLFRDHAECARLGREKSGKDRKRPPAT